jgi:vanillate monooxygenase ferredoxin subunit
MTEQLFPVRVQKKALEARDISRLELVDPEGKPLPPFTAGSHVDVHLRPGLIRQYSLCNDPTERQRYVIGVQRDPQSRGGSTALNDDVNEGDLLQISAPKNHFRLAPGAKRSLLLAGGIGITPLLCMAEYLGAQGADFELHYCTRSRDRTAFMDRIQKSRYVSRVKFHFDDGPAEQLPDIPATLANPDPGTHLYVCGPSGFLDLVRRTAADKGWPDERVHFEYFSASVTQKSAADEGFEVQIASTGAVYFIPKDQTIAKALAEQGVDIPVSCEGGVCGTCLTRVLEGVPDHRDYFLTPEERARNDQILPCCSRSKSARLVLDL